MDTNPDWVVYEPAEDLGQYGIPVAGDRVVIVGDWPGLRINDGLNEGDQGTVIASGRGREADHRFKDNESLAIASGRELTADDYEVLVDDEGPVVRFDNGAVHWFPGQSMVAVKLVDKNAAKAEQGE